MRKSVAAAGAATFFALAPGVVAGAGPWWITGWTMGTSLPGALALRAIGGVLIVAGAIVLVHAFARFVTEGLGTPAPVAPTAHLVVGGLYRHVRNPMYLGVLAAIIGQALLLRQASLIGYAAVVGIAFALFVRGYEEPVLAERYGAEYESYRRAVPGWWPRVRPWRGEVRDRA
jgi:protein-S-isoprenylcysteine O-methyltransferase Ste14